MSSTLLPFLYQTRTLQRAIRSSSAANLARLKAKSRKQDNSIPFVWDSAEQQDGLDDNSSPVSTITPSEAQIFKSIFDEIAQGKLPAAKKRSLTSPETDARNGAVGDAAAASTSTSKPRQKEESQSDKGHGRSIVEQARVNEFREKFLRRYPQSLRDAAQIALGLYEFKPGESETDKGRIIEMEEMAQGKLGLRAEYDVARAKEIERVEGLMMACETDEALWQVMEEEVFSLPKKLGILQQKSKPKSAKKKVATADGDESSEGAASGVATVKTEGEDPVMTENEEEARLMDIHGPLYSQFINTALGLFETAFAHPSPYVFQILPRVKELGLPSFVLGMSPAFYSRLARIHWQQFGDAHSSLDVLREMNAVGLYADRNVTDLIDMIRDNLDGCTLGSQGQFVTAMMESPPYDGVLTQKMEAIEKTIALSFEERARG